MAEGSPVAPSTGGAERSPVALVASGHMVDTPDRRRPRFPPDQVGRVRREIDAAFAAWQVGPGTTLVCGGAGGADIVAADAALARPGPPAPVPGPATRRLRTAFRQLPDSDWRARFRALLAVADLRVLEGTGSGAADPTCSPGRTSGSSGRRRHSATARLTR